MKKYSALLKIIRNSLIIILLLFFLITGGCYTIAYILQPDLVEPNSSFNVKIVLDKDETNWTEFESAYGFLGILLPDGWTVKDTVSCALFYNGDMDYKCILTYNTEIVGFIENSSLKIPEGYHWWGGKTLGKIDLNYVDSISGNITILTGKETGSFKIKYVFGDNSYIHDPGYGITVQSESLPVSMITHSATIRKNEDWELYPNPSKGQIYIRQENFAHEVFLKVYDLNGRLQKSDILQESLSRVDLSALSKGTYIISLENHGEVKTKRLIIQ